MNSEFTAGSVQGAPFPLGITCILLFHTTDHKHYKTYLGVAKLDLLTKCLCLFMKVLQLFCNVSVSV